jgi:hypothetical protein
MINWKLDSCQCVIIINRDATKLVGWNQKCALHKDVADEELFNTLLTHNRQWNTQLSGNMEKQNSQMTSFKVAECKRIKKLGDILRNTN